MIAILKRETLALLQTVTGWLYIAATIALMGLYFYAINLGYGDPKFADTLGMFPYLILITAPVLTMRAFSEERRSKTDQLLLTSPISIWKIVVAKYLAPAIVHTATMVIMAFVPLIILANGGTAVAENYVAWLGFWFYGLCALAIGVFASSLSESQVIAAVVGFVMLFLGFMMPNITSLITDTGWFGTGLKKILGSFDLITPLLSFFDGCISLTGIIYYVTIIALFLFLTTQVIQKRRWTVSSNRFSLGAFSIGGIIIAIALAVFVNLAAGELPSTISQIDVTASGLYSMTDTTKDFLSKLDKDVTIYVIGTEDNVDTTVKQTLSKYQDSSSHIKVEYIDPYVNPTFFQQYTSDNISMGSLIVVCGDVSKVIDYSLMFTSEFDQTTYQSTVTGYDGEGQLTSAIQFVTSDSLPVIYELTGHNETALAGEFLSVVQKANATLGSLELLTSEAVPDDAGLVIINGPQSDLSEDDAQKLIDYIATGGDLLVTLNYEAPSSLPNLEKVLAEYEVSMVPGLVFENDANMYYQSPLFMIPYVEATTYTSTSGSSRVFDPYSKAVSYPEAASGVAFTPLLMSSASAVAKADLTNVTSAEYEEGDVQGPLTLGLEATKTVTAADSTEGGTESAGVNSELIIFGSDLMFTDEADQMVPGANTTLFTDAVNSLSSATDTVVIPAKAYDVSQVTITQATALIWGILFMAVIPLLCLGAGVFIWYRRRKS
ncbi:MAG: Gldg family protein [Propionibacteriaceae bacterium]|jgi:ABC-2 type transport system permease protein|nr:Gldg family protein [Propionibacteriaceae bacterium]